MRVLGSQTVGDEVAALFVEQPKQAEYDDELRKARALLQAHVDRNAASPY